MDPSKVKVARFGVGEGKLIEKENLECFLSYVSRFEEPPKKKSMLERTTCYEHALLTIIVEIKKKFLYLSCVSQNLFLELHRMNDMLHRDYIF